MPDNDDLLQRAAVRIYDQTSMNPTGTLENVARCVATLQMTWNWHFPQCSRNRGHGNKGLYCKQHAERCLEGCKCSTCEFE